MKLYVTTYAKYNRGSLAGKWLDLNRYADKGAFMDACCRLHKDERDPEIMFTDCECKEDWESAYYEEGHIDKTYWDTLKEERAKRKAKKPVDERQAMFVRTLMESGDICGGKGMTEYYLKECYFCQIGDMFFELSRGRIETRFCFDDESEDCNEMCKKAKTHDYFINYNMEHFGPSPDEIKQNGIIAFANHGSRLFNWSEDGSVYHRERTTCGYSIVRDLTPEEVDEFLPHYCIVRDLFRLRLERWYKRFGADKIRTWTYWANA